MVGEKRHSGWALVNENDMRKKEGGRDVNGATRVEDFARMIFLLDEFEKAATLEAKVAI